MSNTSSNKVRKAEGADVATLAKVLAVAFDDDPVLSWAVRQDERRAIALEKFFETMLLWRGMPYGEVTTTLELDACAMWVPPGKWRTKTPPWEQLRLVPKMIRLTSLRRLPRFLTFIRVLAENHPGESHFYLPFIGVLPGKQGGGLGTALLAATLDQLDRDGIPAYLENSNEQNHRLYERHGFRTTKELHMPKGGPTMWCMWRAAAGGR